MAGFREDPGRLIWEEIQRVIESFTKCGRDKLGRSGGLDGGGAGLRTGGCLRRYGVNASYGTSLNGE